MTPTEAKERLHASIAEAAATGMDPGGALVRWVVVGEFVLPDRQRAAVCMSGDAGGASLMTWEVDGLMFNTLFKGRRAGP